MKTVLISGGTSGIGKGAVLQLLKEGFNVSTFATQKVKCDALIKELKGSFEEKAFLVNVGDLRNEKDSARIVGETIKKFGAIDILINNAGVGYFPASDKVDEKKFQDMLQVNVVGLTMLTKHVIPLMKKRKSGLILNISSTSGKVGVAGSEFYNAAKFGVMGYSEGLRLELQPFGIKVSTVCPGMVHTNIFSPEEIELRLKTRWGGKMPVMLDVSEVVRVISLICNQSEHSDIQDIVVKPF